MSIDRRPRILLGVAIAVFAMTPSPSRAEVRFVKGPYLMDARSDRVAVMFEVRGEAPATVVVTRRGQDDGGEEESTRFESPSSEFHEVLITGLEPQSSYDYRVTVGDATATGTLTTAPPNGEGRIRFVVMGDNRTGAEAHAALVARVLEHPADFVLNTGDMVANGASAENWQELFDVEGELLRSTPMFPTLGNHELYRFGVGLPGFLHYTRVPDTLGAEETYYGFDWGPVRFLILDSNDDWSDTDAPQRRWLTAQLEEADSIDSVAHVMVVLHHGPISSNSHGGQPDMLSTGVVHLLRLHGVALVLSGHDHAYERGDAHGVKYIVTGGGGAPLYDENDPLPFQHRFEASHHFLVVEANRERVEVTARRIDDSVIERCGFDRGARWACVRPEGPPDEFVPSIEVGEGTGDGSFPPLLALIGLGAVAGLLAFAAWVVRRRRLG